jgi:hypothetical protein
MAVMVGDDLAVKDALAVRHHGWGFRSVASFIAALPYDSRSMKDRRLVFFIPKLE